MPDARLTVADVQGTRHVVVDKPFFTIGRRTASDVQISSADVSRDHAEIVRTGDEYLLRDRASRYGTFVNGERITERVLVAGDSIRLGQSDDVELVFEPDPQSTDSLSARTPTELVDFRQMAAIMDGLRALGSGRVLDDVLTLVIDSALEAMKAERGFVMLANSAGELQFRIARKSGRVSLPAGTFATSTKIPREVFETGQPQIKDDLALVGGNEETQKLGIRKVVCAPLRVVPMWSDPHSTSGDRIIGVLYLDRPDPSKTRSSLTLRSLEAFATQAAIAIESARLYAEAAEKVRLDRDLRVAAEIQRSLLAQPMFSGTMCDVAAISVPCRTIGGDFFDYFETADLLFTFALADVAGKGPPAALLAAALQSNFAAYASIGGDPARTIASINAALLRRPIDARFATMFHGVLAGDGRLTYCNAGHEPPFVVRANDRRRVLWLKEGGPIVGLFPVATYEFETVTLAPNDLVVVFSDGVTDATNAAGDEFGRARVADVVLECRDRKPEAVLEQLLGAVRAFAHDAPQSDDMTAMVVRYRRA
jgi:serine phosphatase RsbU (regulator of sigma subunit)/pSer/pThr/pTyr-binding forkhead associated (FHA) protein